MVGYAAVMPVSESFRLYLFQSGLLFGIMLLGMTAMVEIGWRWGRYVITHLHASVTHASGTLRDAIFGLLALLIAFTFSGASDRFDHRRDLIGKEVEAIAGAYAAVDLLSVDDQPKMRDLFRAYVDHRITLYQPPFDLAAMEQRFKAQSDLGRRLWAGVVAATTEAPPERQAIVAQLLTTTAALFGAFDDQRLAMKFHPPPIIWISLMSLALIGALVSGYNMGLDQKRDWFLTAAFVLLMVGSIYVILNLEYTRVGHISMEDFDQEFVRLRQTM